jgi:hypothetical protein
MGDSVMRVTIVKSSFGGKGCSVVIGSLVIDAREKAF